MWSAPVTFAADDQEAHSTRNKRFEEQIRDLDMRLSMVEAQLAYLHQQLVEARLPPLRDPMIPVGRPGLRRQLPEAIARHFSRVELDDLLYRLHITEVEGKTVSERARELVSMMDRHGRGYELVDQLRVLRPNLDWSEY